MKLAPCPHGTHSKHCSCRCSGAKYKPGQPVGVIETIVPRIISDLATTDAKRSRNAAIWTLFLSMAKQDASQCGKTLNM